MKGRPSGVFVGRAREPQVIGWNQNDMHRARLDRMSHHISPRELGLTADQISDTNDDAVRALAPAGS